MVASGGSNDAAASAGNSGNAAGTGAWGDVTARQAAKEEEERQARLKVTLRDALFALEYERRLVLDMEVERLCCIEYAPVTSSCSRVWEG